MMSMAGQAVAKEGLLGQAMVFLSAAVAAGEVFATEDGRRYIDEAYALGIHVVEIMKDHERQLLADDQRTASKFLEFLARSGYRAAAANPSLSLEAIEELLVSESDWIRRAAAMNPRLPSARISDLARDDDTDRRAGVAENAAASGQVFELLATDPDEEVRMAIAGNLSAPAHVLRSLASDSREGVRFMVAWNDSAPAGVQALRGTPECLRWTGLHATVSVEITQRTAIEAAAKAPDLLAALRICQAWLASNEITMGWSYVEEAGEDFVDGLNALMRNYHSWSVDYSGQLLCELLRDSDTWEYPLVPAIILRDYPVGGKGVNEILAEFLTIWDFSIEYPGATSVKRRRAVEERGLGSAEPGRLIAIASLHPAADCDLVRRAALLCDSDAVGGARRDEFWGYIGACLRTDDSRVALCDSEVWHSLVIEFQEFQVGGRQLDTLAQVFLERSVDMISDEALHGVVEVDGVVDRHYVDDNVFDFGSEESWAVDIMIAMLCRMELSADLRTGLKNALKISG